jgi:putative FmdB family regulatory protein
VPLESCSCETIVPAATSTFCGRRRDSTTAPPTTTGSRLVHGAAGEQLPRLEPVQPGAAPMTATASPAQMILARVLIVPVLAFGHLRSLRWPLRTAYAGRNPMPRYEYRCRACGDTFEVNRPMASSGDLASCPRGTTTPSSCSRRWPSPEPAGPPAPRRAPRVAAVAAAAAAPAVAADSAVSRRLSRCCAGRRRCR